MAINWVTWAPLGILALILAGLILKCCLDYCLNYWSTRQHRWRLRKQWLVFKKEIAAAKKPECQSCPSFISCAMSGVDKCPLLS